MLTLREADVLRLLAGGCSKKQIAGRLGISPHTVVSHVRNTYRKLQVNTAAAAVMRAVQLRILSSRPVRDMQGDGRGSEITSLGDAECLVREQNYRIQR